MVCPPIQCNIVVSLYVSQEVLCSHMNQRYIQHIQNTTSRIPMLARPVARWYYFRNQYNGDGMSERPPIINTVRRSARAGYE